MNYLQLFFRFFLLCALILFFICNLFWQTMYYPRHIGFPLGEDDSAKFVVVETHYDNQINTSGMFFAFVFRD